MAFDEAVILNTIGKMTGTHPLFAMRKEITNSNRQFAVIRDAIKKGLFHGSHVAPYTVHPILNPKDPCHEAIGFVMDGLLETGLPINPSDFLINRVDYPPHKERGEIVQYSIMQLDTLNYPNLQNIVYHTMTWHDEPTVQGFQPADYDALGKEYLAYRDGFIKTEDEKGDGNFEAIVHLGFLQWLCQHGSVIKPPVIEPEGYFVAEFSIPDRGRVEYAANFKLVMDYSRRLMERVGEIMERHRGHEG